MTTAKINSREIVALQGLADGLTYREIDALLGSDNKVAKSHAKNASRKLGARNNAHAVALAMRAGVVR